MFGLKIKTVRRRIERCILLKSVNRVRSSFRFVSYPSFHVDPWFPCNNRWGAKKTDTQYGGGRVQLRFAIGPGNEIYCRPRRGVSSLRPTAHAIRSFANHEPRLSGAPLRIFCSHQKLARGCKNGVKGSHFCSLVFVLQPIL